MDAVMREAPCGYLSMSEDNRIQEINLMLARMLGYEEKTLKGMKIEYILTASSRLLFQIYFTTLVTLNGKVDEMFLTLHTLEGNEIPVLLNAVRRNKGEVLRYECILFPLNRRTEYEKQIDKAEAQARNAQYRLQMVEKELKLREARLAEVERQLEELEGRLERSERKKID